MPIQPSFDARLAARLVPIAGCLLAASPLAASPVLAQVRQVAASPQSPFGGGVSLACPDGLFALEQISMGQRTNSVLTEDLNGDGRVDLLVGAGATARVGVRLGLRQNRGFGPVLQNAVSCSGMPNALAAGDFDGDGHPDVVVATNTSQGIGFLRGFGDGTFAAATMFDAGRNPRGVASADFDGDGHLDVATVNDEGSGGISVLLGAGDGTFEAPVHYPVGPGHGSLAALDLDSDGHVDLVAADSPGGRVRLLWNSGVGGALTSTTFGVGEGAISSLATADLNGDGFAEIMAGNRWGNSLSVLVGAPQRNFVAGGIFPLGVQPDHLRLADMNRDGALDIVAAGGSTGRVAVLMGEPGGFGQAPAIQHPVGSEFAYAIAIADADGDGDSDVVVAGDNVVEILANNGTGDLGGLGEETTFGARVRSPITADLNGDGVLDVAVLDQAGLSIYVRYGAGDGTFETSGGTLNLPETAFSMGAGDLEGDGDLDILCSTGPASVLVFANQGGGAFAAPTNQPIQGVTVSPINGQAYGGWGDMGDFNGDGTIDLALSTIVLPHPTVRPNGVAIALGDGVGGFTVSSALQVSSQVQSLVILDFEGDGDLDIAAVSSAPQSLSLLRGDGLGGLGSPQAFSLGSGGLPTGILSADFNGDGFPDVAIPRDGAVSIHFNSFGLGFGSSQQLAFGSARSLTPLDVNRDGRLDLALTSSQNTHIMVVFTQNRAGRFVRPRGYGVERNPWALQAGDFDSDGDLDVLSFGGYTESMTLHKNLCR